MVRKKNMVDKANAGRRKEKKRKKRNEQMKRRLHIIIRTTGCAVDIRLQLKVVRMAGGVAGGRCKNPEPIELVSGLHWTEAVRQCRRSCKPFQRTPIIQVP